MSKFKTELLVKVPLDGGDRVLFRDLVYYSDIVGEDIIAECGIITDYGSIPKILHSIMSPTGKPTYGFVIHDKLYKSGKYSKKISDAILEEANKLLGVSWLKRKSITTGLKLGGWVAWNKYRKKDKK
jgi:hypothetical protein